jgi:hypothetical protein
MPSWTIYEASRNQLVASETSSGSYSPDGEVLTHVEVPSVPAPED